MSSIKFTILLAGAVHITKFIRYIYISIFFIQNILFHIVQNNSIFSIHLENTYFGPYHSLNWYTNKIFSFILIIFLPFSKHYNIYLAFTFMVKLKNEFLFNIKFKRKLIDFWIREPNLMNSIYCYETFNSNW